MKANLLRWVGPADQSIPGVPQADLRISDAPRDETEVTPEHAAELVASGLWQSDAKLPAAPARDDAAHAAEEE